MTQTNLEPDAIGTAIEHGRARRQLPPPAARAAIRQAAGVSVRDLASALGVSTTAIYLWEQGRRTPSDDHLDQYMAALSQMAQAAGLDSAAAS